MKETAQRIIIYRMAYEDSQSWDYISNILFKFYQERMMSLDETAMVSANRFQNRVSDTELLRTVLDSREEFKPISKPENFKENLLYDTAFYIYVDCNKLKDVVDLQRLYLIKRSFEEKKILVILEGESSDYFIISHFFEWVNEQNDLFYNSVYFHNKKEAGNRIIRMQKKRVAAFKKMLPLLEINQETDKMLRQPVKEIVQKGELADILKNKEVKFTISKLDLKNSALQQIHGYRHTKKNKLFSNCSADGMAEILENINLLTLLLFADFLNYQQEPYKDLTEFKKVIHTLKRYVQGFLQLTENILFHSEKKKGIFSFRSLRGDSRYAVEKYDLAESDDVPLFEICILDYPGVNESGNIAQVFRQKLENRKLQELFEDLQPNHFFQSYGEMEEKIRKAWEIYYEDVEHIGRHYGLKIFKTLVNRAGGKFVMESHTTHEPGKGECVGGRYKKVCMPGTSYSILMPANFEEQYLNDDEVDFGIANVISYETDLNKIAKIKCGYRDSGRLKGAYANEYEKRRIVDDIENIIASENNNIEEISVVDAFEIPEQNAELLYKALIQVCRKQNGKKYVAFYNCSPEFVSEFWDSAYTLFSQGAIQYALQEQELQIILFTKDDYEEMIVIPNSFSLTLQLNNQINFTRETRWKNIFLNLQPIAEGEWQSLKKQEINILPFDVMIRLEEQGEELSIFEHYTKKIVSRSIQQDLLGCKFEDTHMRLGSTIHVSQFYEAELLFGINLFVERFAFLIALDLMKKLENVEELTFYGFATYSEMLVYKLCGLIRQAYDKISVDYVILERELDKDGAAHVDKLRYSKYFEDKEEREKYFERRKLVCVVPIGSTLKTNDKLINLFCENNGEKCRENILEDYEVILVGNRSNIYWETIFGRRICRKRNSSLNLNPRFFIRFDMEYEESLKCKMCFPDKVLDETPLIEVNAASTIPNQAFGIQTKESIPGEDFSTRIEELEKEMQVLKDCFIYSHTKRGEGHFLFYIQTNYLMVMHQKEIVKWLYDIKEVLTVDTEVYNVIFCPTHAKNLGLTECINEIVFDSSAIIIRDDIDKEYRSNFFAKYSNIHMFVKKVMQEGGNRKIRFFFADDAIVTGRRLQRAKSLLKSIVKEMFGGTREEYCIFDSVFVLIDRNSRDNKQVHVGDEWERHFFAFRTLHVSSLRNHGHACVLCNLEEDAEVLKRASVTADIYEYWEDERIKFTPVDVEEFVEGENYKNTIKRKRAYRRLICANEAGVFLHERYHGNQKESAMVCILQMIIQGCNRKWDRKEYLDKEEMQREFFLSYCKIISRPFIVFNKAVKEAVFDLFLVLMECNITDKKIQDVIKENDTKLYLKNRKIKSLLLQCENLVRQAFVEKGKGMELLHVLLKQLTELKSNYIIRLDNINKIVDYVEKFPREQREEFYVRFVPQVKKLLGVSSDTSKSAWFDYMLFQGKEYESASGEKLRLPDKVYEQLYLENNRVVLDAMTKLCQKIEFTEEEREILNKERDPITKEEYENMSVIERMEHKPLSEYEEQLTGAVRDKIIMELESYLLKDYEEVLKSHAGELNWMNPAYMLSVAAQIMLYQYIERNFGGTQSHKKEKNDKEKRISLTDQCRQIAIYLNHILRAEKTYILVEAVSEADIWEDNIVERYNLLVEKYGSENMYLEPPDKRDYLLLGSSSVESKSMIFNDSKLAKQLKTVSRDKEFKEKGYYISYLQGEESLIWKIGMEESQVYVCSELKKGKRREDYLNDVRDAMQFSFLLNHQVFDVNNTEFFMELIATVKDLNYSSGKKVISHTPYMVRMQQYEQAGRKSIGQQRKGDIIMLLADLNISTHYRESLRREYYTRAINFTKVRWDTKNSVFPKFPCTFELPIGELEKRTKVLVNNKGFTYSDSPKGPKCKEEPVRPDDELICYEVANPSREIFLMLYLMITNSAVGERSEMKESKIEVRLSRTKDGEIRISNKMNEAYHKEIADDFLDVPPYDDEGISIWTVSRYLISFATNILNRELEKLENKTGDISTDELEKLRDTIEQLPKMVRIRVEKKYVGKEEYFSIVLPILAEKYKDLW